MSDIEIEGRCHCGAPGWRYRGLPEGATACNCTVTVCRRYGVLWAHGHEGEGVSAAGLPPAQAAGPWATRRLHMNTLSGCSG